MLGIPKSDWKAIGVAVLIGVCAAPIVAVVLLSLLKAR